MKTDTHGYRKSYIAGCRCFPCTVANAHYIAQYRHRQRTGQILLGAKIAADRAKRLLEQLHQEQVTKASIAHALGLRSPGLKLHDRITVRRYLKIKRVHRQYFSEAYD